MNCSKGSPTWPILSHSALQHNKVSRDMRCNAALYMALLMVAFREQGLHHINNVIVPHFGRTNVFIVQSSHMKLRHDAIQKYNKPNHKCMCIRLHLRHTSTLCMGIISTRFERRPWTTLHGKASNKQIWGPDWLQEHDGHTGTINLFTYDTHFCSRENAAQFISRKHTIFHWNTVTK